MTRIFLFLLIAMLVSSGSAYAQALEKEKWEGRMILPSGKMDTLYLFIDSESQDIAVELELKDSGRFSGTNVRNDEHGIYFKWDYDVEIDCALYSQVNGSYQGTCKDDLGNNGLFAFVPSDIAQSPEAERIFKDWEHFWKGRLK